MIDELLPSQQHRYDGLLQLSAQRLHRRRECVFLILSGLFLGTLAILNILGVTRFIDLSFEVPILGWRIPMPVAIGVLPYPITFLCTDLISELYGRRRSTWVVYVGLMLNIWVIAILYIGGMLPGSDDTLFKGIQRAAFGAVGASMFAYLAAQLIDVHVFHFWKRVTKGRHLWLRNNGSTLASQLIDTVCVILITHYYAGLLPMDANKGVATQLLTYIVAGYTFKLVAAMIDTGPFYLATNRLTRFLRLPSAKA